jgi:hypothetical protein
MRVMWKVGIVDYSASDEWGAGKDSGMKGRGKSGRDGEEMKREWKKSTENIVGREKGNWGKRGLSRLLFGQNGRKT